VYPPTSPVVAMRGTQVDTLETKTRNDHLPRKAAGEMLTQHELWIGLSVHNVEGRSGQIASGPVMMDRNYDWYTDGWSFGSIPLWFYSMDTPFGIYPGGPNFYMIDDANMTLHATLEYPNATSVAMAKSEALICQDRQVRQAFLVPLYSSRAYIAYKAGMSGVLDVRGYGLSANMDLNLMNMKSATYKPGPPPTGATIIYGALNPPDSINPVFSSWLWDYDIIDRIFTGPMIVSPYNPTTLGKSPSGRDLPWMAYDWKYETMANGNANVTYWFRHDLQWHDGVAWTVDDFNYTIYLNQIYGDSWGWSDMVHVVGFQKIDSWTCSLQFDFPSYFALYTAAYDQFPEHIYKYIAIPPGSEGGATTTGHHGEWPGKDCLNSEVAGSQPDNPNPFTFTQLTTGDGGKYVWVGTNMWKYRAGTYVADVSGGITLDAFQNFWMKLKLGEMTFRYAWNAGTPPQGGSYTIQLADLVMLAQAYGTNGTNWAVPFLLGGTGVWESGCDVAPPGGVGLSDLVTLAQGYLVSWGANP